MEKLKGNVEYEKVSLSNHRVRMEYFIKWLQQLESHLEKNKGRLLVLDQNKFQMDQRWKTLS